MADFYGVNATKRRAVPAEMLPPGVDYAKCRVAMDSYEAVALAAASTIHMMKLPKGARVITGTLHTDDLSADVTLAVGISGATGKYLAAVVCTTANQVKNFDLIDAIGEELTAEEEIIITTAVSECAGTIKLYVIYTIE